MSTLLCSRHHRSSPGCLSSSQTGTLFPLNANSPGPAPQPLATAPLLSVSMNNLPALGTSCTWNRTVLVFRSWLRHLTERVENFSLLSFPQRVLVQCASQSRMPGLNRDGQISGPRWGPQTILQVLQGPWQELVLVLAPALPHLCCSLGRHHSPAQVSP